jgi:hypothetical protein
VVSCVRGTLAGDGSDERASTGTASARTRPRVVIYSSAYAFLLDRRRAGSGPGRMHMAPPALSSARIDSIQANLYLQRSLQNLF